MKKTQYIRKGHLIHSIEGKLFKQCTSINEAKRESRKLQPRLGDGTVRVQCK